MKLVYGTIFAFFVTFTQSFSCPDQCKCNQIKSGLNVDCSNKNFDTIPNGIPNNTVKLDLSGNIISNIGDSSFLLLSMLTDLKLNNNEIKTISPSAFNGLTSLLNLYMVHCGLSEWSEDFLTPLKKLASLYLTDNEFQIIPNITSPSLSRLYMDKNKFTSLLFPNNFKHNVNLQSLVLSNNNIPQINDGDFFSLADLTIKSLKLSQCGLKNISSKALSNLPHLKTLDLNSNGLVSSQLDIFLSQVSRNLESLSVDDNLITNLSAKTFNGFANGMLNSLNMDGNPLSLIDPQAFSHLTQLTHLSLRKCKLSSIGSSLQPLITLTNLMLSNNQLYEVPNFIPRTLQSLDMSTTQLRILPSRVLENADNLKELFIINSGLETIENESFSIDENSMNIVDFSNNPFKCDCSLAWFRNWINGTKVTVRNVQQYLCGSPESFKGKPLLSFSAANCSQQPTTTSIPSSSPSSAHSLLPITIISIEPRSSISTHSLLPTPITSIEPRSSISTHSLLPTPLTSIEPTSFLSTHSKVPISTSPSANPNISRLTVMSIVLSVVGIVVTFIFSTIVVIIALKIRRNRNERLRLNVQILDSEEDALVHM